ncbi:FRG domain-containing protein [Dyella sp. OK004]|uniref:FRG domain-containing protein n=1 Tax=Dyella sp. OK004 TaxID=1855292 RepID=UPI0015A5F883|nr:FRG domain-containing protein [Dyella sp. OK004]
MKWFRGASDTGHALVPSLYRHPTTHRSEELLVLEHQLVTRFRERAQPMIGRPLPEDKLEMLFLMQHHGMPTRLLDWSENAFIALFFALSGARKDGAGNSTGASCVWLLKPILWNKTVQSHINYSGEPFSVGDARLTNGYVEVGNGAALMQKPVAVYGVHNSPRIVSQRGVFTFFGSSVEPMEEVYTSGAFEQDALMKVEIRGSYQDVVFNELKGAGILDSTVYPDLDGLARELRRATGYEVR